MTACSRAATLLVLLVVAVAVAVASPAAATTTTTTAGASDGGERQDPLRGSRSAYDEIGKDDWEQLLSGEWMVKFYLQPCLACSFVEPAWEDLARHKDKLGIRVGGMRVDEAPADLDFLERESIAYRIVPALYHVKNGVFRQYKGQIHQDLLTKFVQKRIWRKVAPIGFSSGEHPISTDDDFDDNTEESRAVTSAGGTSSRDAHGRRSSGEKIETPQQIFLIVTVVVLLMIYFSLLIAIVIRNAPEKNTIDDATTNTEDPIVPVNYMGYEKLVNLADDGGDHPRPPLPYLRSYEQPASNINGYRFVATRGNKLTTSLRSLGRFLRNHLINEKKNQHLQQLETGHLRGALEKKKATDDPPPWSTYLLNNNLAQPRKARILLLPGGKFADDDNNIDCVNEVGRGKDYQCEYAYPSINDKSNNNNNNFKDTCNNNNNNSNTKVDTSSIENMSKNNNNNDDRDRKEDKYARKSLLPGTRRANNQQRQHRRHHPDNRTTTDILKNTSGSRVAVPEDYPDGNRALLGAESSVACVNPASTAVDKQQLGKVTSAEQKRRYKREFYASYAEYLRLHGRAVKTAQQCKALRRRLQQQSIKEKEGGDLKGDDKHNSDNGGKREVMGQAVSAATSECEEIRRKLMEKYVESRDVHERYYRLHNKLRYIKRLVAEYEAEQRQQRTGEGIEIF